MNVHRNARTNPKIREEIHASKCHMTIDQAVEHFNVSRNKIIKWRQRENFNDKSHRPNTLKTALFKVLQHPCKLLIFKTLTNQVQYLPELYVTHQNQKND